MSIKRNIVNKLSEFKTIIRLIFIIGMVLFLLFSIIALSKLSNQSIINNISYSAGDFVDPVAQINISTHTWSNYSSELDTLYFDSSIVFNVDDLEDLITLEEVYYYDSNVPLTEIQLSQLSWVPYSSAVSITTEGTHIIYIKVVDTDTIPNDVGYLNTDILIVDTSKPSISIDMDISIWTTLKDDLTMTKVYVDRAKTLTVTAEDDISGVDSVNYYITNDILDVTELGEVSNWVLYSDGISIDSIGSYIVYVKVIDKASNIKYVNTDNIVLDGYTEVLTIGRNDTSYDEADNYITSKSTITLDFVYENLSASDFTGYTHNLISNTLLPVGTKITLMDYITNKVYKYEVTTEVDSLLFTLFKEIGTGVTDKSYTEGSYYNDGVINEHFKLILDFSGTNLTSNYDNVNLYIELHDNSDNVVRPTQYSTIDNFNIYTTVNSESTDASLSLTTDYSGGEIIFNSNSSVDINITSSLNYKVINDHKINDTTYEDKEIGFSIKLVNSEGITISRDYYKNVIFKLGNSLYYPEADGIMRINLNSGILDVTKVLTIITGENSNNLEEGTYYLKITSYASVDGYYTDELNSIELSIPVTVEDNNVPYSFDVITNDENRIINRSSEDVLVSFNILQNGELDNPNIRVSLYKKDQLTAFNQDYSIVDLYDYVSNELNLCEDNIYYVSIEPVAYVEPDYLYNTFELYLMTSVFENTGYKYVFDLYDGSEKIGTIEKYFIIKEAENE